MVQVIEKVVETKLDFANSGFPDAYASITPRLTNLSASVDFQLGLVKSEVESQIGNKWTTVTENPDNCYGIALELNPIASAWLRDSGVSPISFEVTYYIQEFRKAFHMLDTQTALSDYLNHDMVNAIINSADLMIDDPSTNHYLHQIFTTLTLFDTVGVSVSALAPWLTERKFNNVSDYSMIRYQLVNGLLENLERQGKDEIARKVIDSYLKTIAHDMGYYTIHSKSLAEEFKKDLGTLLIGELSAVTSRLRKLNKTAQI